MNGLKIRTLPFVLVAVLVVLLMSTGVAEARSALSCGGWSIVKSQNPSALSDSFSGLAPLSTNNVWAVGYYYDTSTGTTRTLTERWNGTAWKLTSSPSPSTSYNELFAVAAVNASDMWAVGSFYNSSYNSYQTLTMHWNGTAWKIVSSPNLGNHENFLNGITAVSTRDVWAVGHYESSSTGQYLTLTEHWNGSRWQVVSSPSPGNGDHYLNGIKAISANNIWAVGHFYTIPVTSTRNNAATKSNAPDQSPPPWQTLVEHWNGTAWKVVGSPNIGGSTNKLYGVTAVSANNIWAVGYSTSFTTDLSRTLIEHWNGSRWSIVSSRNPGLNENVLYGVAAVSASDIWAVGYSYSSGTPERALIEHWNGTKWSIFPGLNTPSTGKILSGVARVPNTKNAWAVGRYPNNGYPQTLTAFYC